MQNCCQFIAIYLILSTVVLYYVFQKHKAAVEEEWSFEDIKLLREIVYTKMKREGKVIKVWSSKIDGPQLYLKNP